MKTPLVSIIIPTLNRAHLIGETLESVLAQTYQHWECIVVDDGSTDGTDKVLAHYMAKDPRFQYHHRPKDRLAGGNAARNYGLEVSKGEYIQWFDSDDLMLPTKLECQLGYFLDHGGEVHICQGQFFETHNHKKVVMGNLWPEKFPSSHTNILDALILESLRWPICAAIWSRKAAHFNLWNEKLLAAQEWTFHILQAFSLSNSDFAYHKEVLVHIRKTELSITQSSQKTNQYEGYLQARTIVMEHLLASGYSIDSKYFKSIYMFSLRYVKYLASENSFKSIGALTRLFATSSNKKHLKFKFGIIVFKYFEKDYFLKTLL